MNDNTTTLLGEVCPKCKSVEAWHGVIVEPGERERFACDECGFWMAVQVTKPKPPKTKDRRFEFSATIENGHLFVEFNDSTLLTFRPGKFLELGTLAITSMREIADREDAEFYRGLDAGRKNAERETEESVA